MKIVFVSQIVPYPPHGGVLQRGFNLVRELGRKHEVDLLAYVHPDTFHKPNELEESKQVLGEFCRRVEYFPLWPKKSQWHKLAAFAMGFPYPKPFSVLAHRSKAIEQRLRELIAEDRPDLVHLDTIALAPFQKAAGDVPCVLTHHNIESALMARRSKVERTALARYYVALQAKRLARYEAEQSPKFPLNVMVSRVDADHLRSVAPGAKTLVVENGVDIEYFKPIRGQEKPALIYTGGMNMFANKDAVMWFLEAMWPRLKKSVPELEFYAVGQDPPEDLRQLAAKDPSIHVTGFVDDVRPLVAKSAVYVVPLRVGGGTRLKVVDAMAQGKAIVSTAVGCEGIRVTHGKDILIADEPEPFADHVLSLLQDEQKRLALGDAARSLAESDYAWPSLGDKLIEGYEQVLSETRGHEQTA